MLCRSSKIGKMKEKRNSLQVLCKIISLRAQEKAGWDIQPRRSLTARSDVQLQCVPSQPRAQAALLRCNSWSMGRTNCPGLHHCICIKGKSHPRDFALLSRYLQTPSSHAKSLHQQVRHLYQNPSDPIQPIFSLGYFNPQPPIL